jgi:hypothetical protein
MDGIFKERKNCWELKNCGREPGGSNVRELGICPAASDKSSDGINGGKNGGRLCWSIAGSQNGNEVLGSCAKEIGNCFNCEFYIYVKCQEGGSFCQIREKVIDINSGSLRRGRLVDDNLSRLDTNRRLLGPENIAC